MPKKEETEWAREREKKHTLLKDAEGAAAAEEEEEATWKTHTRRRPAAVTVAALAGVSMGKQPLRIQQLLSSTSQIHLPFKWLLVEIL